MRYRPRSYSCIEAWRWEPDEEKPYPEKVVEAAGFLKQIKFKKDYEVDHKGGIKFEDADGHWTTAQPGFWILKMGSNKFLVMSHQEFRMKFEPVYPAGYQYDEDKHP